MAKPNGVVERSTVRQVIAPAERERFFAGLRAAIPYAVATGIVGLPFGLLAIEAGLSPWAAVVMSLVVYAGSAQFAAVSIVASGGAVSAAVVAAAMMNSRFLAMGAAFAPSLPGPAALRALQGQAVVDTSWAMALRPDGSFDRHYLFGATSIQYVTWAAGTAIGAFGYSFVPDVQALGLDAVFPAFFLALLIGEARTRLAAAVAVAGAVIALILVPFAPIGLPVLVAGTAALVGLRQCR